MRLPKRRQLLGDGLFGDPKVKMSATDGKTDWNCDDYNDYAGYRPTAKSDRPFLEENKLVDHVETQRHGQTDKGGGDYIGRQIAPARDNRACYAAYYIP
jgi:hypothetical protein